MVTLSARTADDSIDKLAVASGLCVAALTWIDKNADWVTEQQIQLTEIPAPEFNEAQRAEIRQETFRIHRP